MDRKMQNIMTKLHQIVKNAQIKITKAEKGNELKLKVRIENINHAYSHRHRFLFTTSATRMKNKRTPNMFQLVN